VLRVSSQESERYTRRRKTKQKQSRETDNIRYTRRRKTKQKQSRETDNEGTQDGEKQNKKNPEKMLSVSLDYFCFVFLRLVYPMLSVSLDCFCFIFLRLVYPMLSVSLDCFSPSCVPTKTKQKQSRETDNIGYTRRRKTKQKQSRETDKGCDYLVMQF
jgi:hypothetical protein